VPASTFYFAENYHQKYMLRQAHDLMAEYETIFPDSGDFINSTAVARANGYVNGYVDIDIMEAELPHLGLSSKSQQSLLKMAKRYN
jgi:peptide-methionine (S)-S-oxide reductase